MRKSATIERVTVSHPPPVKTGADALAFFRRKENWLDAKNIARIEHLRAAKRRSART